MSEEFEVKALPCKTVEPEVFFPANDEHLHVAQRLCAGCHKRVRCLDYAITSQAQEGVWGGVLMEKGQIVWRRKKVGRPRGAT